MRARRGHWAHPGRADLRGFGRSRSSRAAADDIEKDVLYRVGACQGLLARAHGTRVVHVKPHGALYNQAAEDEETVARDR